MPENLESTFVDLQEWIQLDCFVIAEDSFAYTIQSIILIGLNIPRKHSLIW